jgi:hypothetical protein
MPEGSRLVVISPGTNETQRGGLDLTTGSRQSPYLEVSELPYNDLALVAQNPQGDKSKRSKEFTFAINEASI